MPFSVARPERRIAKQNVCLEKNLHGDNAKLFYSPTQATDYTTQSNHAIQCEMTEHAVSLLGDIKVDLLLDAGCGSGLSINCAGSITSSTVLGFDASFPMLSMSQHSNNDSFTVETYAANAAHPFPLRSCIFDAAISISMIQWLCYGEQEIACSHLCSFFTSLFNCLTSSGRAVLQAYPDGIDQARMLVDCAGKAGFIADLVVDYPHSTTARKWFLCLNKCHIDSRPLILRCPFGRRFNQSCALNVWARLYKGNDRANERIKRLHSEHINHAYHIIRKVKRSVKLQSLNPSKLHPKALKSLTVTAYEISVSNRLVNVFGEDIALSDLQRHPDDISRYIHEVYESCCQSE